MKNRGTYRLVCLLYMAIAAMIGASCVKEDLSNCPVRGSVVSIIFTDPYDSQNPQTGLNADEFSHVTIFIYDQSGQLVMAENLYGLRLDQEYSMDIKLPPGSYELVAWIGAETSFYRFDHTDIASLASLSLIIPQKKLIDYQITHLYYGQNSFKTDGSVVQIPLIQFTNDINYTIKGLDKDGFYTVKIEDNNGKYGFDGSYLPFQPFGYVCEVDFSGKDHASGITVMRLGENRKPMLSLTDNVTGQMLYPSYEGQQANLVALIKKAYENNAFDFDSRHIFNLSLVFDAGMRATVFINDWEVKDDDYEI